MTAAERLAYARWLRTLPTRTTFLRDDRARLERLADELEQEGLEQALEENRAAPPLPQPAAPHVYVEKGSGAGVAPIKH